MYERVIEFRAFPAGIRRTPDAQLSVNQLGHETSIPVPTNWPVVNDGELWQWLAEHTPE